jgi:hypothetical protein
MLEYNSSLTQCQHPVDFVWPLSIRPIQPRAKKRLEAIAQRYVDNAREREFGRIDQDYEQSWHQRDMQPSGTSLPAEVLNLWRGCHLSIARHRSARPGSTGYVVA